MVWQNRECWKYYENCWTLLISDNKKIFPERKRSFLLGIVRMRGGALHMGKGRSNNAGKKQPNFDDSSNFAKQSQPTEKKKK